MPLSRVPVTITISPGSISCTMISSHKKPYLIHNFACGTQEIFLLVQPNAKIQMWKKNYIILSTFTNIQYFLKTVYGIKLYNVPLISFYVEIFYSSLNACILICYMLSVVKEPISERGAGNIPLTEATQMEGVLIRHKYLKR